MDDEVMLNAVATNTAAFDAIDYYNRNPTYESADNAELRCIEALESMNAVGKAFAEMVGFFNSKKKELRNQ